MKQFNTEQNSMNKENIENCARSLVKHGLYRTMKEARIESTRWHNKRDQGSVEPMKCPHRPDVVLAGRDRPRHLRRTLDLRPTMTTRTESGLSAYNVNRRCVLVYAGLPTESDDLTFDNHNGTPYSRYRLQTDRHYEVGAVSRHGLVHGRPYRTFDVS